jgi:hypothetical protein
MVKIILILIVVQMERMVAPHAQVHSASHVEVFKERARDIKVELLPVVKMNEWLVIGAVGLGALVLFNNQITHHATAPAKPAAAAPKAAAPPLIPAPGGGTLFKSTGRKAAIANPAGQNQQITYASSGKAATSHRVDVAFNAAAHEATVFLSWPAACTGGGHPELAIKHWGPNHTDSTCCWCYGAAVPSGANLNLGFGGEGPHPTTQTLQTTVKTIPFQAGKLYGFKSVIWPQAGGGAHQELYYNDGSGFKLAGTRNTPTCGATKTETAMNPAQQIEFRIDCANVTFSQTDVTEIVPGSAPALGAVAYAYPAAIWSADVGFIRPARSRPTRWATRAGTLAPAGFPHTDLGNSC